MTIAKMGKVIAQDDRHRHGARRRVDGRAHGARPLGSGGARPLPRTTRAMSDEELFDKGYNRVYDTLEMEANLNYVEEFTRKRARRARARARSCSSEIICRALGKVLAADPSGDGRAAQRVPARTCPSTCPRSPTPSWASTSATWAMKTGAGRGRVPDPMALFDHAARATTRSSTSTASPASPRGEEARHLHHRRRRARATGPRRSGPTSTSRTTASASSSCRRATSYAVRICPEPTHWGGLSGCTLLGGRVLGQVRAAGRGRPLRRGVRRRHHGLAAADQGRPRGAGRADRSK